MHHDTESEATRRMRIEVTLSAIDWRILWAALVIALVSFGLVIFDSPMAAAVAASTTWNWDTAVVIAAVAAAALAAVLTARLALALWGGNLDRLDTLAEARATRERIRRVRGEKPMDRAPSA